MKYNKKTYKKMENIIEEGEIKGAIDPASMQQTKAILEQMERSVCRITSENKNGSGFFCKIELNNKKIPVLITNYHIISDEYLDSEQRIKIYLNNKCMPIKLNKDRKVYSSSNDIYDIMILKINDIDNIQNINFLELDSNLLEPNSELAYEDSSIYILHYPSSNVKVSYGYGIKEKSKNDIMHKCKTAMGSSGAPILNLSTNKVIGIHKSYINSTKKDNKEDCYNLGTLLKYPLIDMNKKNSKNVICVKISTKLMSDNKRLNNKRSKNYIKLQTSQISNIYNEIEEKLDKKPRGSITEHKYNHEHLNTDINQNYYPNESKNEKINNNNRRKSDKSWMCLCI